MKRGIIGLLLAVCICTEASAQSPGGEATGFWDGIKAAIQRNLARPYVWGASGLKSFDCSGFIWRVMYENGILLKRTTARKFYMTLPKATQAEQATFGTLVFFNDLKHVGIIDDATAFYHAQVSIGTNRSKMTPFWRQKIYGYRKLPSPSATGLLTTDSRYK
jgi:cell wall-associated NlpC family hydrolase